MIIGDLILAGPPTETFTLEADCYTGRHAGRQKVHEGQHPETHCLRCELALFYTPRHARR
jgi:hypothetical protein